MVSLGRAMSETKEGPTCGNTATPEAKAPDVNQTMGSEATMTHVDSTPDPRHAEWRRWVDSYQRNHGVMVQLASHFREQVANHRHIGSDEANAFLRANDFTDAEGGEFKVNHNGVSTYMRELCREFPDLAPHIRLRKSPFDRFYGQDGGHGAVS